MGGGPGTFRRWNFTGTIKGVGFFLHPKGGGLKKCHASLANIFNKCHKKAVFIFFKTIEFGYIKYKLGS